MTKRPSSHPHFPSARMRRTRASDWSRRLVRESSLSVDDLIWPLFVCEGKGKTEEISSMPGVLRHSVDGIVAEVAKAEKLGIPASLPHDLGFDTWSLRRTLGPIR